MKVLRNLQVVRATEPSYQLQSKLTYLSGSTLMLAGIPIKFFAADDAVAFKLTASTIEEENQSISNSEQLTNAWIHRSADRWFDACMDPGSMDIGSSER